MISFELDALQLHVREEFGLFASRFLRPFAAEADRLQDVPAALLDNSEALNYGRAFIPEEFGGGYRSLIDGGFQYRVASQATLRVLMCEEIGYGDAALYASLPGPGLAEPVLRAFASPRQQEKFFEIFQDTTPRWAAFAMTEPGTGSDIGSIATSAVKRGDRYVLNGRKWLIGNGARADWVLVFAMINPGMGQFGVRAFVVERGTPGFRVGRILPTMGMKALRPAELVFEDCEVGQDDLLGTHQRDRHSGGFQAAMRTLYLMRPAVAAMAIGAGRSALALLEEELNVNGARHAMARRWTGVRERVEEMKRKLDAARLLCLNASLLYDHGKDNSREASMAKALSAKVAMEVSSEAMELGAATGMTPARMSDLDRIFRNAKVFDIVEGTGDIQRLTVLGALLRHSRLHS
jgi:acyl-CoA dehydrogenase